jgi:dihydrofolate reductase
MSHIPSSAIPHAYVHDDPSEAVEARRTKRANVPRWAVIGGASLLGLLLLRRFT